MYSCAHSNFYHFNPSKQIWIHPSIVSTASIIWKSELKRRGEYPLTYLYVLLTFLVSLSGELNWNLTYLNQTEKLNLCVYDIISWLVRHLHLKLIIKPLLYLRPSNLSLLAFFHAFSVLRELLARSLILPV